MFTSDPPSDRLDKSVIYGCCKKMTLLRDNSSSIDRVGCCTNTNVIHVHNAMISDGHIILYFETAEEAAKVDLNAMPVIVSMHLQQKHFFKMPVKKVIGTFPPPECNQDKLFEGTLHIHGRSTVKNVYHALVDNFILEAGGILLDAIFARENLYKPRMYLSGVSPPGSPVPHIQLLNNLFSAGAISLVEVYIFYY